MNFKQMTRFATHNTVAEVLALNGCPNVTGHRKAFLRDGFTYWNDAHGWLIEVIDQSRDTLA